MTNLNDLTLAEINEQIELLEVAERFGSKLQEFTEWLSTFAGGEAVNWVSDDPTVQFVLGGLRDAAFEFSETLGGFAENFEPLTDAAGAVDDINTAVQTALSIVTAIDQVQEDVGADKAGQLADILSNLTSLSQLLTGLSLNPIIGVFIGLYATALKSAMIPIQIIADRVAIRDEVIESSTEGIDIAAAQAAQQAADDAAAETQLALTEQLNALYARRGELIADLQGGQYVVALDFAASRHPDEMQELIDIASEHGGVTTDAPINGETLGQLETWAGSATGASFDLITKAANAPEGSEARANAINSLNTLNDARHRVTELLGPIRGTVTGALETYGYSTADPGPQASVPQAAGTAGGIAGLSRRAVMIGGGGIFAVAMVGLVLLLPGGGGDAGLPGDSGGSSSGSSSSSGSASSGASGSFLGLIWLVLFGRLWLSSLRPHAAQRASSGDPAVPGDRSGTGCQPAGNRGGADRSARGRAREDLCLGAISGRRCHCQLQPVHVDLPQLRRWRRDAAGLAQLYGRRDRGSRSSLDGAGRAADRDQQGW